MPGKNGYELCAAVKSDPALCNIPVLLLTGTFEPFDEEKAAQSGADGWIAKPFESQTLINRVHKLLDQAVANAPVVAPPIQMEEAKITDESSTISEAEGGGGMAAAAEGAFSRITSYNVCYTKLLRRGMYRIKHPPFDLQFFVHPDQWYADREGIAFFHAQAGLDHQAFDAQTENIGQTGLSYNFV